jgi:MazG family protein
MSQPAGARLDRLMEIMHILRGPDGCPWDREQTLRSLRPFVIEETSELLDALDAGDMDGLREELGDVVFEAVFLAELCAEAGHFALGDALQAAIDKLIRRHPHVFTPEGDRLPPNTEITATGVKAQWDDIKNDERQTAGKPRKTILGGVPRALPALLRAETIGRKVSAVGFDWSNPVDVLDKVDEEVGELREALATGGPTAPETEEELGDLFFALANLTRKMGLSPEAVLRQANDKFQDRFELMEQTAFDEGHALGDLAFDDLDRRWNEAKALVKARHRTPPATAPDPDTN